MWVIIRAGIFDHPDPCLGQAATARQVWPLDQTMHTNGCFYTLGESYRATYYEDYFEVHTSGFDTVAIWLFLQIGGSFLWVSLQEEPCCSGPLILEIPKPQKIPSPKPPISRARLHRRNPFPIPVKMDIRYHWAHSERCGL